MKSEKGDRYLEADWEQAWGESPSPVLLDSAEPDTERPLPTHVTAALSPLVTSPLQVSLAVCCTPLPVSAEMPSPSSVHEI